MTHGHRRTYRAEVDLPPAATAAPALVDRRSALRLPLLAGAAVAGAAVSPALLGSRADAAAPARHVYFRNWQGARLLRSGTLSGLTLDPQGRLVIAGATTARTALDGRVYTGGSWASPWVREGFMFTELIPSWIASTPGDSFIVVDVRGRDASGRETSWDNLARWAQTDAKVRRTSFGAQEDDLARVSVDTWRSASSAGLRDFQVRVWLYRLAGATTASPTVTALSAMTSRIPTQWQVSPPLGIVKTLDVPRYSQMIHQGHYPQYGNGGEAWCSPTSVSMVLGYYGKLPPAADFAWVPQGHANPWVDHAARSTYDIAYRGCGNWSFSAAYAATRTGSAYVTRLRSLREAEEFIAYGVPVIASIAFGRGQLRGAPISASNGHLLVIVGFTASGDVVVNDPAAPQNSSVRRTYRRSEFEAAWLPRSGGLVYVITDAAHPVPNRGTRRNW